MYKIEFSISDESISSKPKSEILKAKISNSMRTIEVNSEEFNKILCGKETRPYCSVVFDKKNPDGTSIREIDNFLHSQMIALDYDYGITRNECIGIFKSLGVAPTKSYFTYSNTPELERFRLLFLFTDKITDIEEFKLIIRWLSSLTTDVLNKIPSLKTKGRMEDPGKPDPNAKAPNQYFYGGEEQEVLEGPIYTFNQFKDKVYLAYLSCFGNKSESAKDCFGDYKQYDKDKKSEKYNHGKKLQDYDFDKLADISQLFSRFIARTPELKLEHDEFIALATTLNVIEGGKHIVERVLDSGLYNECDKARLYNGIRLKFDWPISTSNPNYAHVFSAEEKQWTTLAEIGRRTKKGEVTLTDPLIRNISLEDAVAKMYLEFDQMVKSKHPFCIGHFEAGLGKTTMLADVCVKLTKKIVMAFKTHDLAEQFMARLKHKPFYAIPFPELKDKVFKLKYLFLLNQGRVNESQELFSYSDLCEEDLIKIEEFKENRRQLREAKNILIVCTHEQTRYTRFDNHSLIIYDENPSFFKSGVVYLSDLEDVKIKLEKKHKINERLGDKKEDEELLGCINKFINWANNIKYDISYSGLEILAHKELGNLWNLSANTRETKSNFSGFSSAGTIKKKKDKNSNNTLVWTSFIPLPEDKRIIILSGTPTYCIYDRIFPDYFVSKVYGVIHGSKIIIHTSTTGSKTSVQNSNYEIDNPDYPIITHRDSLPMFSNFKGSEISNKHNIYFGNQVGTDVLAGMNGNIIGNSRASDDVFIDWALCLGIKIPFEDCNLNEEGVIVDEKEVSVTGYRFFLRCHRNDNISNLQVEFMASELDQAIARFRYLRYNVEIHVYGTFFSCLVNLIDRGSKKTKVKSIK